MKRSLTIFALLAATSFSPNAFAAKPVATITGSPFEVNLDVDLQLTLTGLLITAGPTMMQRSMLDVTLDPLPTIGLPIVDRGVVGNDSGSARAWSDRLLYAQVALPHLLNALDVLISQHSNQMLTIGLESMVLLETAAMTNLVTVMAKTLVGRPRPFMFDPNTTFEERSGHGSFESFPSGHTSVAFSMATAYSYLFMKKHPSSPFVIPLWIGSHLVAGGVGLLRVEAGRHFWTDVVAGAALGSAIGFLVPYLHLRDGDADNVGIDDVRIFPSVSSEGFGINAMWFF